MQNEILQQLFFEMIKLTVSGILGGVIGSFLSLKLYKEQKRIDTKHEEQMKKQEALFEIGSILHWIRRDISVNWESPANEKQTPKEYMFDLMNRMNYWRLLFLDDIDMSKALQSLNQIIGASKEEFFGENKVFEKMPSEIIYDIEKAIEQ